MEGNASRWFEIYVQNISRAVRFYETVFETKLTKLEGTDINIWAFPMFKESPGSSGALVEMPGFPSGGNSTIVYFASGDCSKEQDRVLTAGGSIQKEKFSIGQYGFIFHGIDTEGNMFGVHSLQ